MMWTVAAVVLLIAVVGFAAVMALRSPLFLAGVAVEVVKALLPTVLRSSPETQARAQQAAREGHMGDLHGGREK